MSCASTFSGAEGQTRGCRGFSRRAWEIVGVIFAFFYFWPLAVGYLVWKFMGYPVPTEMRNGFDDLLRRGRESFSFADTARFAHGSGRNHAFEEYRRSELKRLDEERRRLDEEARAFADFVDELKRAKDREEFDAFMNRRRGSGTTGV